MYSVSGRKIAVVAAGQDIAIKSSNPSSGSSNPHWLQINYASKTSGGWSKINGDGVSYGFVDTGLEYGSVGIQYHVMVCGPRISNKQELL